MDVRAHFHEVAQQRKVLPIGSDLVLHERDDPEAIRRDGEALGKVIVEAAERYDTKVAFPLMDLQIEKEYLLSLVGIEPDEIAKYHFGDEGIEAEVRERVERGVSGDYVTEKMKGTLGALEYVANTPDLIPVGMSIGPFSFLTKLIDDPITNVYLAAQGEEDDEEAILVKDVLEVATMVIDRWLKLQIEAGAKAIVVCEPAANVVYLSPNQLEEEPEILDQFVMQHNLHLKRTMDEHGVELIFHDCGELIPPFFKKFAELNPAVFSAGSPTDLSEAAQYFPQSTVLFGNLPSKKFYSDAEYPEEQLRKDAAEIRQRVDATGHPHILGSECDVLSVEGYEETIRQKVKVMLNC